jgi:hypothetical protein
MYPSSYFPPALLVRLMSLLTHSSRGASDAIVMIQIVEVD